MKLKSEHKPESEIVVDGERVEGYELPPDPLGNARQQRLMREAEALRRERERTAFARLMERVATVVARRRKGFDVRLWPTPYYLDCCRLMRPDGVVGYRVEVYWLGHAGICVEAEFWRSR